MFLIENMVLGNLPTVSGTDFDLRIPTVLGDVILKVPNSPGYDSNFCITRGTEQENTFVAKITHPNSGRTVEIYSNQPGVQFYTGNFLPKDNSLVGKGGSIYKKHGAFCSETQLYPDAINNVRFFESIDYQTRSLVFLFNRCPIKNNTYKTFFFFSHNLESLYYIQENCTTVLQLLNFL